MKQPGIYYHLCPTTRAIRYVGKSTNWPKRTKEHLKPNRLNNEDSHHHRWLRQLRSSGLKPIVGLIEEFPTGVTWDALSQAEIYWIDYFKSSGSPLTNETPGGEGHPISEATKEKIRQKLYNPSAKRHQPKKLLTHDELITSQGQSKAIVDNNGNTYPSIKEAARQLNLPFDKIADVTKGRRKTWKGYAFRIISPCVMPVPTPMTQEIPTTPAQSLPSEYRPATNGLPS